MSLTQLRKVIIFTALILISIQFAFAQNKVVTGKVTDSKDGSSIAYAAAIYGSRGANRVILITTKSSKSGKVLVEYNGFAGIEKNSNELNMLNADEWRKATADMNAGDRQ